MLPDHTSAQSDDIIWRAAQQKLVVLAHEDNNVLWVQLPSLPPVDSLHRHTAATDEADSHARAASTRASSSHETSPPVVLGEDSTGSPVYVDPPVPNLAPSTATFQPSAPADAEGVAPDVDLQPLMDCLAALCTDANCYTIQFTDILEYVNALSPRPYRSMPKVIVAVREAERLSLLSSAKTADGRWCVTLLQALDTSAAASGCRLDGPATSYAQAAMSPVMVDASIRQYHPAEILTLD